MLFTAFYKYRQADIRIRQQLIEIFKLSLIARVSNLWLGNALFLEEH